MDSSRLRQGEIIAGIGGVALFIFLFLDWFGAGPAEVSGWDGLGADFSGFVVFAAVIAAVTLLALGAMGLRVNVDLPRGLITSVIGTAAVVVILLQIFATPEGADVKFALFLGLAAAVAIALGALMAVREGGFEPLVQAAGSGGPASSAASPPAAKPAARRASSAAAKPATRSRSATAKSSASRGSSAARKRTAAAKKK